jgi:type IV pilus assembly protein PilV
MTTHPNRAKNQEGFTLIEVMMALTILFIGVMGVVALERATIVSNVDARQVTTASNVARTWLERLQADAAQWNHPSTFNPQSDLNNDTVYLKNYNTGWFLPVSTGTTPYWSNGFDINGNDVTVAGTDIIYCANVRLTPVYLDPLCQLGPANPAPACPAATPSLLRAEVRVYWSKRRSPIATCGGAAAAGSGSDPVGSNDTDYHWVYLVGVVGKVTAQ